MKRKGVWIAVIAAVCVMAGVYIYAVQVERRIGVQLFRNVFVDTGIDEDGGGEVRLPFEVMLGKFAADTARQGEDGYYAAVLYLREYGADEVTTVTLYPYDVAVYGGYRIYLDSFSYNKMTDRLFCMVVMERRRYQTWID